LEIAPSSWFSSSLNGFTKHITSQSLSQNLDTNIQCDIACFPLDISLIPEIHQFLRWTNIFTLKHTLVYVSCLKGFAKNEVIMDSSLLSPPTFQVTKFNKFCLLNTAQIPPIFHDPFCYIISGSGFIYSFVEEESEWRGS
jgi:hypothetical protein